MADHPRTELREARISFERRWHRLRDSVDRELATRWRPSWQWMAVVTAVAAGACVGFRLQKRYRGGSRPQIPDR